MSTEPEGLGDLDGEPITLVTLSLTGNVAGERRYGEGERVVLVVDGTITDKVTVRRLDGRLVRAHVLRVTAAAPPADQLAGEVESFLQAWTEKREGKTPLPFPDAGDADPSFTAGGPPPDDPEDEDE